MPPFRFHSWVHRVDLYYLRLPLTRDRFSPWSSKNPLTRHWVPLAYIHSYFIPPPFPLSPPFRPLVIGYHSLDLANQLTPLIQSVGWVRNGLFNLPGLTIAIPNKQRRRLDRSWLTTHPLYLFRSITPRSACGLLLPCRIWLPRNPITDEAAFTAVFHDNKDAELGGADRGDRNKLANSGGERQWDHFLVVLSTQSRYSYGELDIIIVRHLAIVLTATFLLFLVYSRFKRLNTRLGLTNNRKFNPGPTLRYSHTNIIIIVPSPSIPSNKRSSCVIVL